MFERSIRDCNVAVVGGCGFLGSHLVNHLIDDRKCNVVVIDNLVVGRKEFLHPKASFCHADITHSEEYLYGIFQQTRTQYVFNYAAYPYIPDSFERPLHVFTVNANGALNVINAAQRAHVSGILQVSSAEIYGNWTLNGQQDGRNMIQEDDEVHPHSSYGASKAAVDFMVQARWREDRTRCIALRQFNCIGERETHPYVLPEIITQLYKQVDWLPPEGPAEIVSQLLDRIADWTPIPEEGRSPGKTGERHGVVHLGNNSSRDFMYAGDAVAMAVQLLEDGKFGEVYNLGSEESIKVYDLAKAVARILGFTMLDIRQSLHKIRPWEIWHLQSNNSKINEVVTHRPTVTLDQAIVRTLQHYIENKGIWAWEKR